MPDKVLTARQQHELEFYEEFGRRNAPAKVSFDPIAGAERRPWNSYWHLIERVKQNFRAPEQRLLDFGCGKGENGLLFAKLGYEVFGFDLAQTNVNIANSLAEQYGLADRTHFSVSVAEELNYPADYFDLIVGTDILHHVEIRQALAECFRVLKPGGLALFHEPVRVSIFDTLRETSFGRWLVPKTVSLDRQVTEDEKKLTADDLAVVSSFAAAYSARHFLLFSRLNRFVGSLHPALPVWLSKLDAWLFTWLPFCRIFAGIRVIELRKL